MYCPLCGKSLDPKAKFCTVCGMRIDPAMVEAALGPDAAAQAEPAAEPVVQPASAPEPDAWTPAAEPAVQPEPVVQPAPASQPDPWAPQDAAPRQGLQQKWIFIAAPAALILGLVCGLIFWNHQARKTADAQFSASRETAAADASSEGSSSGTISDNPSAADVSSESGPSISSSEENADAADLSGENGQSAESGASSENGSSAGSGPEENGDAPASDPAADRMAAYAGILRDHEAQHGTMKCLTWEDLKTGIEGYPHTKGVYYADLLDLDGDGAEELVIAYSSIQGEEYHADCMDVYSFTDHGEEQYSLTPCTLGFGVDVAEICWYTYADGIYLVTGSYMGTGNEVVLNRFDGVGFVETARAAADEMIEDGNMYYFDFGKGAPVSIEEYVVYGLYNEDREEMAAKLRETKNALGITEEPAPAVFDEVKLRQALAAAVAEPRLFFLYDDFDGDGIFEAFAGTGSMDNSLYGRLYFISADGAVRDVSGGHELSTFLYDGIYDSDARSNYLVDTGTQKFFVWENSAGGSGSTSYVFGVRSGEVYEPAISGHAESFGQRNGNYVSYESDFSKEYHDYIETYYRFDANEGEFYRE